MQYFRQELRALAVCLALAVPAAAHADAGPKPDAQALIDAAMLAEIRDVLASDILRVSIAAQNELRGALTQEAIDALDKTWRAEREQTQQPLIAATLASPLSVYLIRKQAASLGLYSEIFVMDANGLNVGQSSITSDYWQGDEAKYQNTFPNGADAVFVDEPEWHEPTRTWRAQISLTVADPQSGRPIGAATFELNLTELTRRRNG